MEPYQQLIVDRLDRLRRNHMERVVINMPPRYGKSFIFAQQHALNLLTEAALTRRFSDLIIYGTDNPSQFLLQQEASQVALVDVISKILKSPLNEIEIVKDEIIPGADVHIVALYHPGFCPNVDDVWLHTSSLGSADHINVSSMLAKIKQAQEDDTLLAKLSEPAEVYSITGHNMLEGNEEAMLPEDPGASGVTD